MDIKPLDPIEEVSEVEFRNLFVDKLDEDLFARALAVHGIIGPYNSFRVANVIHMGIQKGNVAEILSALEDWCDKGIPQAPNMIVRESTTHRFFDVVYDHFFMHDGDIVNGFDTSFIRRTSKP